MSGFIKYIADKLEILTHRTHMFDMFTYQQNRPVYPATPTLEHGIVFAEKPKSPDTAKYGFYVNGRNVSGPEFVRLPPSEHNRSAPFSVLDTLEVPVDLVVNSKNKHTTTIGRFMTNQVLLAQVFGDKVPFTEGPLNINAMEATLGQLLLDGEITTAQYKTYLTNGYSLGHLGDIFTPSLTTKGITIDKGIIRRRDELLELHKDVLDNPKVVAGIEAELIGMYREYIKGSPDEAYLSAIGDKALLNHIKTKHIMVGAMADFGGSGENIVTVTKSLEEGWDRENFPHIANAIRKGSHNRGERTQDAGAVTKSVFRAMQDIKLEDDDCKTTNTIPITFDDIVTPAAFIGRAIVKGSGIVIITTKNQAAFANSSVKMRSPMTCASKGSMCYMCAGQNFKKLGITHPGTLAVDISSTFMLSEMKSFHDSTIAVKTFDHTEFFV